MATLDELVTTLATRDQTRPEAMIQADIRNFIESSGLNIDDSDIREDIKLESQLGDGSKYRIDIEVGSLVIEVKKNLDNPKLKASAVDQLSGYLNKRVEQTGIRYLGVLTDGRHWHLYVPRADGAAEEAGSPLVLNRRSLGKDLLTWLSPIMTLTDPLPADGKTIREMLGQNSPAHAADHRTLTNLYESSKGDSEIQLKRELWAKLLRTAFGSAFSDDDALFIDHTLLVLSSEIIAHAVLGFDISDVKNLTPEEVARGERFKTAGITGVVESDFFDWVLEVEGGAEFVSSLQLRLSRFNWKNVDHDALKHLYESVIPQETRQDLGEYYTPDWIAAAMVQSTVQNPLSERVLDPACGSGTFIFQAVRHYLDEASESGMELTDAIAELTQHVMGMDIHPVSVTLARVTYLLAIGSERLNSRPPQMAIPVYLGDSLQWEQNRDLFSREGSLTISTAGTDLVEGEGGGVLFDDDLVFPESVVDDVTTFDSLIAEMADEALAHSKLIDIASLPKRKQESRRTKREKVTPILLRHGIEEKTEEFDTLVRTFDTLEALARSGRDHIWSYYARNLVRPAWLSRPQNRVDVLIGNPPWLRFARMGSEMQKRYKYLCKNRNLISGPLGASGRDLSTLFVVRSGEKYLKENGKFSYVMPWGTLNRKPHAGFRSGDWDAAGKVEFERAWDFSKLSRATGFPAVCCVLSGSKSQKSQALSDIADQWTLKGARTDSSWESIRDSLVIDDVEISQLASDEGQPVSPYKKKFRQGAIFVPRMAVLVEEGDAGPLGAGAGRTAVRSRRTSKENKPWKDFADLHGVVEQEFISRVLVSENVLPFRVTEAAQAVLPVLDDRILNEGEIASHAGLLAWWKQVEQVWEEGRKPAEKDPLRIRLNYHDQLAAQFPRVAGAMRVVYPSSGTSLLGAVVRDGSILIDNSLYWAPVRSENEALYLVGILNSRAISKAIESRQAIGLFGRRHIHKLPFDLMIPPFNSEEALHMRIANLSKQLEGLAAEVPLDEDRDFVVHRRKIRTNLAGEVMSELDESVLELIGDA
ncbi:SAM-dependent DNA methyltransferase [Corynebacterium sp. CCUG 59401]|nr:SAM-dependent DNA methyltransferase [Corynebacterium pseudogenitalium]